MHVLDMRSTTGCFTTPHCPKMGVPKVIGSRFDGDGNNVAAAAHQGTLLPLRALGAGLLRGDGHGRTVPIGTPAGSSLNFSRGLAGVSIADASGDTVMRVQPR
jgi:hypothetical protein